MNIEFANRLTNLRKEKGYSQEELAEKIGISRQAISKWERAESSPDTDNLIELSRLYRISLDELLNSADYEEPSKKIDSQTVILNFKRSLLQKKALLLSAEFVVDNEKTFRITPDSSIKIELPVGLHTIRASIPLQNNENYAATSQVDITSDTACSITYSIPNINSSAGELSVNEASHTYNDKNTPATSIKHIKNIHLIVLGIIAFAVIFSIICGAFVFFTIRNKDTNTVITSLNKPYNGSVLKITATEITSSEDPENPDEVYVGVKFIVENVSGRVFYFGANTSVYVDNVSRHMETEFFGETGSLSQNIAPDMRMEGYIGIKTLKKSEKVAFHIREISSPAITVMFVLNIPNAKKTGTSAVAPSSESQFTESASSEPSSTAPSSAKSSSSKNTAESVVAGETTEQSNAVKKAKSYLKISAFSRDRLIAQLEFEKFSNADAIYGADNSGANWTEQAVRKAESYLKFSAFSRDGLISQLEFEKFSNADAVNAVDAVGADWNEQAAKKAKSYIKNSAFSRERLIEQLIFEKFTREQAEYGVNEVGL